MAATISLPSSFLCYREAPAYPYSSSMYLLSPRGKGITPLSLCKKRRQNMSIKAVAEDETVETLAEVAEEEEKEAVSVPVSPSDMLTMFFKAEGMMDDSAATNVTKALKDAEGISDLKVQIAEGIASVELTKQTTVQATGVASNLVEIIQGSGFKLQTLNLSFEDEEDAV